MNKIKETSRNLTEIKRIPVRLTVKEYLITYEYDTWRGYTREDQRRIKHFDRALAKECFLKWSKNQRTMTNVKILGMDEIENNVQEIVL